MGRPQLASVVRRATLAPVLTVLAVVFATGFVLLQLHPGLLVTDTTPAGGDMGAHVWAPAFMRDHLIGNWSLTGWAPDWYAGFPVFTFYFPLPSLAIVLLDVALPYGVAFKLVTVLGLVTMPVSAYVCGRLMDIRFPGPAAMALGTLPFLFDRGFTIYGGNIPSTLAGEFSFSISLSATLLFLGVFARSLRTGQGRALAAALLAVAGLCHLLPTLFAGVGALVLLAMHLDWHRIRASWPIAVVGGALGAFWWFPFWRRLPYANDMGWEKLTTFSEALLRDPFRPYLVLAAVGGAAALAFPRRRGALFFLAMAVISAATFRFFPEGRLWNARFLPFWYLSVYMLASLGAAEFGHLLAWAWRRIRAAEAREAAADADADGGLDTELALEATDAVTDHDQVPDVDDPVPDRLRAGVLGAGLLVVYFVVGLPLGAVPSWVPIQANDVSFIPGWARWNYEGYERKAAYPEYHDVITTMERVGEQHGCGRAHWEYEPELDRMGTPMALMLLPYWTRGCIASMEGLYFESSATTPYHFLVNSEVSLRPPRPQRGLPYRELDLTIGVPHLQLLGVRYYMALSDAAKAQADAHPDLTLIDETDEWTATVTEPGEPPESKTRTWRVYEVARSDIVVPLAFEPVVIINGPAGGERWQDLAVEWWNADPSSWEVPFAPAGPRRWRPVPLDHDLGALPRRALDPVRVSNVEITNDRISFEVDRTGVPVLVKTSYFPNWQVTGADGVWRVSPNQMVVIPTDRQVRLDYGTTSVDWIGRIITFGGLVGLVLLARRGRVEFPEPVRPEPGAAPLPPDSSSPGLPPEEEPEPAESLH